MLFRTAPQAIWDVYMLAVCGFALWKGGRPERIVALASVVASIATALLQNRRDWISPQWGDLAVDCTFLAVLLWLALRSNRHWPMWAAAFQLLGVVIYVARLADVRVGALAPFLAGEIWSYLVLASLAVGTWFYWQARPRLPQTRTG